MRNRISKIIVLVTASSALAFGGIAVAQASNGADDPAGAHHNHHRHHHHRHHHGRHGADDRMNVRSQLRDDRGGRGEVEPGDDRGGRGEVEPGDDRGGRGEVEPGDDHGGRGEVEAGDDSGGHSGRG